MRNYIIGLFMGISGLTMGQTSFYVNQSSGSNSNNGLSPNAPFQSINSAISIVTPGDTIFIMGQYTNPSYNPSFVYSNPAAAHLWHGENTILINNLNGSAGAYITLKSYNGTALLKGDGENILRIRNSSYLRIEGFEIEGETEHIPLSTALALQFVYIDGNTVTNVNAPVLSDIRYRDQECVSNCTAGAVVEGEIYSNMNGQNVIRPSYTDTRGFYLSNIHHIDILKNRIHHTPGGGLRVSDCEDINIIENEIHHCSGRSSSGTHGLVVTKATSTRNTNDYRIYILRNKVHHNYNGIFSWSPSKVIITPLIDEGKGISLQRNQTTYNGNGSINVNWEHGRILVANNLCYFNGYSGVHSNDGNRIDFINNTCYFNSYTRSITEPGVSANGGNIGISAQGGSDIRIINNISVIDAALNKSAISSDLSANDGLVVSNNIIYGTDLNGNGSSIDEDDNIVAVQVQTQMINPLFTDALNLDFTLQEGSPAINVANTSFAPTNDFNDSLRDNQPDLGAFEFFVGGNDGESGEGEGEGEGEGGPTNGVYESFQDELMVYPNPAATFIQFTGNIKEDEWVRIQTVLGESVMELKVAKDMRIDVSQLSSGFYFIIIENKRLQLIKN